MDFPKKKPMYDLKVTSKTKTFMLTDVDRSKVNGLARHRIWFLLQQSSSLEKRREQIWAWLNKLWLYEHSVSESVSKIEVCEITQPLPEYLLNQNKLAQVICHDI